ncbi:hypothetical protein SAMN02745196_00821 [Clostridium collagenovorans DSM 3089]|uniref:tRNA (Uracil-5-)-methyltransferase n=1 Tax=Clostridium collagenovorans DSM 3089 TaxID=1121306 RepID=A0A1M5U2T5_9CLOT|nr:tRNA (uracil-5-)-methyltransferase [Clostridium collagenovorans]SHH57258.1 hypothetical protein SAMN02745196_00821 [Clostridium collagenovorans DSM 3089]
MNKITKTILIVVLAVGLVGSGIFVGMNWNYWFGDKHVTADVYDNAEDYTGDKDTYTGKKNTDTIDIPGFDTMNFKVDTVEQSVNLYNPKENTCYFKMTIILNDGTRLWESKLVEPNKAIYDITINQSLSTGIYDDCTLKYECFKMDETQTPLNGSEIKFTLNVLE